MAGIMCRGWAQHPRKRIYQPALPSIIMENVRSLPNKMVELVALTWHQRGYQQCSIYHFVLVHVNVRKYMNNFDHESDHQRGLMGKPPRGTICPAMSLVVLAVAGLLIGPVIWLVPSPWGKHQLLNPIRRPAGARCLRQRDRQWEAEKKCHCRRYSSPVPSLLLVSLGFYWTWRKSVSRLAAVQV